MIDLHSIPCLTFHFPKYLRLKLKKTVKESLKYAIQMFKHIYAQYT